MLNIYYLDFLHWYVDTYLFYHKLFLFDIVDRTLDI